MMRWTPTMDAVLRAAFAKGQNDSLTADQIANDLGIAVTVNALAVRRRYLKLKHSAPVIKKPVPSVWDKPGLIARLLEHHKRGDSARQSAALLSAEFKLTLTRNSVIGKWTRLGLPPHTPDVNLQISRVAARQAAPPPAKVKAPTPPKFKAERLTESTVTVLAAQPAYLVDLKPSACRYPVSGYGGDTLFCANPQDEGSSYCPGHRAVCGSPPPLDAKTRLVRAALYHARRAA